jgi:hypothetical protein
VLSQKVSKTASRHKEGFVKYTGKYMEKINFEIFPCALMFADILMLSVLLFWVSIVPGGVTTADDQCMPSVLRYNFLYDLTPEDGNDSILLHVDILPIQSCLDFSVAAQLSGSSSE